MLLKASGDTCSDKLRTILLMEADFNMNNKKLSCKGMRNAEHLGCIAPEQAGGRNRHTANESSLNSCFFPVHRQWPVEDHPSGPRRVACLQGLVNRKSC